MMLLCHVINHEMIGVCNVRCMRYRICKSVMFVNAVVVLDLALEPVYSVLPRK